MCGNENEKGTDRVATGMAMQRKSIEELREKVSCNSVLENAGFAVDLKESTRRAVKFRRSAEIIIVTHEGRGWFDPLSDDKGDVFTLVAYLEKVGFVEAVKRVAELVGFRPSEPEWRRTVKPRHAETRLSDRWSQRRRPRPGSATWRYLSETRYLPTAVLRAALAWNRLREGPYGSMWAVHTDDAGTVCGWEERGPEWRGFASGGTKVLFRFGPADAPRLCVTEAAIDAMSLAAIEGVREDTLYLSTGGGWSPSTDTALRALAAQPGVKLIAATDANSQGETYAARLRALAEDVDCQWQRLRPPADDWNEALRQREVEKREKTKEWRGVPHARRPRQGRLRPAEPALDSAGRDAGGSEGVMQD